jgi:hypothetical protein
VQNLIRGGAVRLLKLIGRTFYAYDVRWLSEVPAGPWHNLRIICFLNHTSLYEWLFAGAIPNHLLRRIASKGYVPVADITISRPLYGSFLRMLAPKFLSITREPDHTWQAVLDTIDDDSMIIIFPEGRMKRANGLDKHGQPMTVRGGIADLLKAVPNGRMLIAYSGGLHHVQVPGQLVPRPFRRLALGLEFVDIATYRAAMEQAGLDSSFKIAVKSDLQQRRDLYCSALESY